MENFIGQDGFVWFTGVVEDRQDPDKLGRVRVRCVGYHTDNKIKIPTADLPWAWVMMPTTTSSMNGLGQTPPFLVEGTWVIGFFRDADTLQEPVVMGTLPGKPSQFNNPNFGFNDPRTEDKAVYGPYPIRVDESDMNRRSVGSDYLAETRKQEIFSNIGTADGEEWAEPESPYEAVYPYNHVYETESGHIREFDDTKYRTRIHERHRSGSYYEIDDGGNKVLKIVGDGYEIIAGSRYAYVKGTCNLTVDSNCNTNIKGNYTLNVDKDMTINVGGRLSETVKGSVTEIYEDTKTENVKKAVVEVYEDTKNESVTKKVTETFAEGQQTSITGEYDLDATGAMSIESDSTIKINQPSGTQLAARKGDTADTGDDPAGISAGDGSNVIEAGSGTVFIGDTGSVTDVVETDLLEVDLDPVETVRSAYGLDNLNMDATQARAISDGRAVEVANGIDPDTNEGIEYGDGGAGGTSPVTGEAGPIQSEASLNQENYTGGSQFDPYTKEFGHNLEDRLRFLSHTDPRINPQLGLILEDLAESYGSTLTITSAYRSPAYNKKVGGAKKSVHQQGLACDVLMNNTTKEQRLDFIRKAAAAGIKGLGLYFSSSSGANFIHCDLGNTRQWGPSGSRKSQYGWAKPTLKASGWFV